MLIRQSRARKASVEHANTSPKGTAFRPNPALPEGLVALSSKANDLSIYGTQELGSQHGLPAAARALLG